MSEAWTHLLSAHGGVKVKLLKDQWQLYVRQGTNEWQFAASGGIGDNTPDSIPHRFEDLVVDAKAREATLDSQPVRLATKEFDLLYVLASDPTKVFHYAELAKRVWGYEMPGRSNALKKNAARLRKKLDGRFVHTCWGIGYRLLRESE